jgi:hypothetical protein
MTALSLPWVYPSIGESMRGDASSPCASRHAQQRHSKGEMLSLDDLDERRGGAVESRRRAHGRSLKVDSARWCVVPSNQRCSQMSLCLPVYACFFWFVCHRLASASPLLCILHCPDWACGKGYTGARGLGRSFGWADRENAQRDGDTAVSHAAEAGEDAEGARGPEEDGAAVVDRGQGKFGRDRGAHEIKHCSNAPEHVF